MPSPKRFASLYAVIVQVRCPYCDEPQPSPEDESDNWQIRHIAEQQTNCVDCDRSFRVARQKAHVHP